MTLILALHGPRDLRYEQHRLPALGPNDVRVHTTLGAISAGTEGAWYFGTDPQLEPGYRVGRFGAAGFPRRLGYEKVAAIEALGGAVDGLEVGQRVVGYYPHAQEFVVGAADLQPVPDSLTDEEAVSYSLATVALHAIRRSRLQIGDDVFVTGLGFLGLMTVRLARLAGAGWVGASDPYDLHREFGTRWGADRILDPSTTDVGVALHQGGDPESYDVAFETSSSFEALRDAMGALRRNGRLCVVSQLKGAYPRHPAFGVEFHLNELELISSDGRGDVRALTRWYFRAVQRGDMGTVAELMTHRVSFEDIEAGYGLLETEPENVVKILVTYD